MSQTVKDNSVNPNASEASEPQKEEQFVPKGVFTEVTNDMHKFKSKYKSVQAELEALKAEREAEQRAQLEQQNQFQKLYEDEKKRRAALEEQYSAKQKEFQNFTKRSALKAALGDVKDEYLTFANLDNIELMENGQINPESVHKVANDFRQNHPALVSKPVASNITGQAAPIENGIQAGKLDLSKLSLEEKKALLRKNANQS